MIRDLYDEIREGREVRKNLIALRQELKEQDKLRAFLYYLGGDFSILEALLSDEDPKVRKNTALILGSFQEERLVPLLYGAYEKEETLFVKSAYLTALKGHNLKEYAGRMKERISQLSKEEAGENRKHIAEELKALSDLLAQEEGIKTHRFTGMNMASELILPVNRNFIEEIMRLLPPECEAEPLQSAILVHTDSLEPLFAVRTWRELLFSLRGARVCPADVALAAGRILDAGFLDFIRKRHEGDGPFYFRIECKSRQPLDKRSNFTKKLAAEIEFLSGRKLVNSTSNYEVEIRMIENKSGSFHVLFKLFTLPDTRFSYRKEVIASSIKPVNAALLCMLADRYLKENARILDPFCGTGTMLIERHKWKKANTMYGIDIYAEAVEKAKINTQEARQIIHYINRDFFDFKHEYLFDEILTDMPFATAGKGEEEIERIYRRFFKKAGEHLEKEGVIVMYSRNREFVRRHAGKSGFEILEAWDISNKDGVFAYVLVQK